MSAFQFWQCNHLEFSAITLDTPSTCTFLRWIIKKNIQKLFRSFPAPCCSATWSSSKSETPTRLSYPTTLWPRKWLICLASTSTSWPRLSWGPGLRSAAIMLPRHRPRWEFHCFVDFLCIQHFMIISRNKWSLLWRPLPRPPTRDCSNGSWCVWTDLWTGPRGRAPVSSAFSTLLALRFSISTASSNFASTTPTRSCSSSSITP